VLVLRSPRRTVGVGEKLPPKKGKKRTPVAVKKKYRVERNSRHGRGERKRKKKKIVEDAAKKFPKNSRGKESRSGPSKN